MCDGELKLHLGCGDIRIPGWTNIDIRETEATDIVADIRRLFGMADCSVDMIYACHVLDHFSRHEYMDVLRRWYAVLKPGGILRLSVVNFAEVVDIYRQTWDLKPLIGLLVARQDYPSNVRHMHWDYSSLSRDLSAVGFSTVRPWNWRTTDHAQVDDFSQAHIPHMDKENGRLVSLNIEGVK